MSSRCDLTTVQRFLECNLSKAEQIAFENHVGECEECRLQLRSEVDEDWWGKPSEFLATDAFDADLVETEDPANHDLDLQSSIEHDGLQRVLELLAPSEDPSMLGRLGRYEITGAIGFGGMAVVLKGFEAALNRFVAVKVLAPHLASSRSARERFSREARAAASVLHPNVIAIHCVADFKHLPYLVMPYVAGGSLQERMDAIGRFDLVATVRIGMQVAAGLAAAHAQGLVHRDIKPANILLEPGLERVVITDFGLARAADDASITQTGILAGTPHYMSPEQATGARVDDRSDLFSLGSLLFTLTTGRVPFEAETSFGVLRRITDDAAPRISSVATEVPIWLDNLVARLHLRRPEDRYPSASEVSDLLKQCLASLQQPEHSVPESLLPDEAPSVEIRLIAAILCLVAVSCFVVARTNNSEGVKHVPHVAQPQEQTPPAEWPSDGEWLR